jgi:hypothetical protein
MKFDHHTSSWTPEHERGLKLRGWGALVAALLLLGATAALLSSPAAARPAVGVASQEP